MKKVILGLLVAGAYSLVSADGKAIYAKCAACHGEDGKNKALGKSAAIAGQDAATILKKIKGYKAGTLNQYGQGQLMKGQVSSLSDDDMKAVADYIATLK
ncbi:MAG: cytochrome c [Sulfurospirillum sp.]|nr:MAG: cytochrome c [Sulfurospirillum sp.]